MTISGNHIIGIIRITILILLPVSSCEYNTLQTIDYSRQTDSITDIDGNKYKTIGIGTQIWMQENLKVTHYSNGTRINLLDDIEDWHLSYNSNIAGFCWYDNDSVNNKSFYGALYNFHSIGTGLLCPTGWHVPGQNEWKTLIDYVGGKEIAGGKLKDYNGNFWTNPNHCIENNINFVGLPAGNRTAESGKFRSKGFTGCWWANRASDENNPKALQISVGNSETDIYETYVHKSCGASIRCVKD